MTNPAKRVRRAKNTMVMVKNKGGEVEMTYGQLFMKLNPNVKVVENGTCMWLYFDGVNHDTFRVEWWNKEISDETLKTQEVPDNGGWISVKDRMPPERENIFAKLNGTKQWNPSMFMKSSDDVRVAVRFEDGTRMVTHDHTFDGKWYSEKEGVAYPKRTVTHWMPNPDLPKENKE